MDKKILSKKDGIGYGARDYEAVIEFLALPEMVHFRKVIKIQIHLIFAGILFLSFTLTGYLFYALLG